MSQQGETFEREDYSQTSESDFRWPALDNFHAQPQQTFPVAPRLPLRVDPVALERQRERRAATGRIVVALFSAIPLTGIVAGAVSNSLMLLPAIGLTWIGIAMVVWVASGCPNPFKKN